MINQSVRFLQHQVTQNNIDQLPHTQIALYADHITLFLQNEMFLERSEKLDCFPEILQVAAQR